MNLTAKITLTEQYYSASFDAFAKYGSKRVLFERIIGSVALVAVIILVAIDFSFFMLTVVLTAVAVVDLLGSPIRKFFWMRRAKSSKEFGKTVEFGFSDRGISSKSEFSSGEVAWAGLDRAKVTPNGILVWPTKGIYTLFPTAEVGQDVVDYIREMVT